MAYSARLRFCQLRLVTLNLALSITLAGAVSFSVAYAEPPAPVNNTWGGRNLAQENDVEDRDYTNYIELSEQANQFISNGQLSQAIDVLQRAIPLAPKVSLAPLYNNLAAVYMRRGNYFLSSAKQPELALLDFEEAFFLLNTAWPAGITRSPLHERNRGIAKENVQIAFNNMAIKPTDRKRLIDLAQQQRSAAHLRPASVTLSQVLTQSSTMSQAERADVQSRLADIYSVLNRPDLAISFYQQSAAILNNADSYAKLGSAQFKAGQPNEAVKSLDRALSMDSSHPVALGLLEEIWASDIRNNPGSILGRANLAGVLQKRKAYDAALQLYTEAERLSREGASKIDANTQKLIRLNLGTLYQEMAQPLKALEAYNSVISADPSNAQALYYRASLYKESALQDPKRLNDAVMAYNQVLSKTTDVALAQSAHDALLALFASGLNHPNPAVVPLTQKLLDDYVKRYALQVDVQLHVAEMLHKIAANNPSKLDAALSGYERALLVLPGGNNPVTPDSAKKRAAILANQAVIYQAKGDAAKSRSLLNEARKLDAQNSVIQDLLARATQGEVDALIRQGVKAQQSNDTNAAITAYDNALAINTNLPEVKRSLAGLLQQRNGNNDAARAASLYEVLIKSAPDDSSLTYALGTAYQQAGDLAKARLAYQQASQLPEAQQALLALDDTQAQKAIDQALSAYQNKQFWQAQQQINVAIAANSKNAVAYYTRGLILEALKKPQLAIADYQKATTLDPNYADAFYALGVVLDAKADKTSARSAFERYLELQTADTELTRYVRNRLSAL
ncbi:MAG: tetratricopeptide repeat protein [Vampirovibrionales bacterium]|nr:tetratricopeptide repeat protein [Vampirovibrionales bacterium]